VYTAGLLPEIRSKQMTKTLIKHGNSLALVIDKPILEMLQISADTPLELSTNGDLIVITPVRDARRQQILRSSLKKINAKFGDDLRRLAE
jgi:antitoxin component of MazEF toxin-antitoxin module